MGKSVKPKIVTEPPGPKSKKLMEDREAFVPRGVYAVTPIFVKKAEGAVVQDVDGNIYLDFSGGIGVLNAGHCPPKVVEAIKKQAEKFLHTCFHVLGYEKYVRLAEELTKIAPGNYPKKAFFLNSGAEAVENAVKIAIYYTGRPVVIAFENAFHGRTRLTMALTSKVRPYKFGFLAFSPNIERFPYPYCYRCPFGLNYPECGLHCLSYLERGFVTRIDPQETAAILIEPVQGEGGFIVPPKDYLKGLREISEENNILFIDDEVQSGMGRTGKMFAIEHFNVEPDLITVAKSIAAGLPLAGVIGEKEIMDAPHEGGLGGTFGGNPVACAAALEAIKIIKESLGKADKLEKIIDSRLREMKEKYELVGDVRGLGPMAALELVKNRKTKEPAKKETKEVIKKCYKRGLIILSCGIYGNVLRILAPLIISEDQLNQGLDIMEESIKEMSRT